MQNGVSGRVSYCAVIGGKIPVGGGIELTDAVKGELWSCRVRRGGKGRRGGEILRYPPREKAAGRPVGPDRAGFLPCQVDGCSMAKVRVKGRTRRWPNKRKVVVLVFKGISLETDKSWARIDIFPVVLRSQIKECRKAEARLKGRTKQAQKSLVGCRAHP